MNDINLFLAEANEKFKIVVVKFPNTNKKYHYKTILNVEVGDLVIVDAPSGIQILTAVEVIPAIETELSYSMTIKWLVDKVDMQHYEECKQMEREATKTLNQLKYTRKRRELMQDLSADIGEDAVNLIRKLVRL